MPLPSRSESARERLPPVSCARMRERIGAACHLWMSPSIGRAPFPANQSRRVRHLIWIPTQRFHDTRCHHRAPLLAPHQDQPMPLIALPPLGLDQKPDPASSRPSCACASYGARFFGLTSGQHRCVCSSSPSQARCCYHARGFEALRPALVRRPEEEVTPLSALPCQRGLRPRHERWPCISWRLAPPEALVPNPGGSARSLMSRPTSSGRFAIPRAPRTSVAGVCPAWVRKATVSHGVSRPSAHAEAGSDLYRGYLPRLRGVLGLSRPLDALLRPSPVRPCFMPVAPLGLPLSEVSPLQ
jgi:hypothetical protein